MQGRQRNGLDKDLRRWIEDHLPECIALRNTPPCVPKLIYDTVKRTGWQSYDGVHRISASQSGAKATHTNLAMLIGRWCSIIKIGDRLSRWMAMTRVIGEAIIKTRRGAGFYLFWEFKPWGIGDRIMSWLKNIHQYLANTKPMKYMITLAFQKTLYAKSTNTYNKCITLN